MKRGRDGLAGRWVAVDAGPANPGGHDIDSICGM